MTPSRLRTIRVELGARSYPIQIGVGALDRLPAAIARHAGRGAGLVVTDRNVWRHHGATLRQLFAPRRLPVVVLPPGEGSKSAAALDRVHGALHAHRIGRDGHVIAFGGGVVGDLAGFAAATWHRGIPLVMVPTTLLAQVDSAVGGKVGINRGGIKNVIGAFHQPVLVVADIGLLRTLPAREFRSALAEVVKYGMIADARLLQRVDRDAGPLLAGDPRVLVDVVAACCRIKARVVSSDETERGPRAHLNFGHTIGHALEAASDGALRHGEAVALGMRGAVRLATVSGRAPEAVGRTLESLLDTLGLPREAPALDPDAVFAKLKWDKKVRDGRLRFVLTPSVGSASVAPPMTDAEVRGVLRSLIGGTQGPTSAARARKEAQGRSGGRRRRA